MDWNRVEGNWKEVKGKIKQQWGQLTDNDLAQTNGRRRIACAKTSTIWLDAQS